MWRQLKSDRVRTDSSALWRFCTDFQTWWEGSCRCSPRWGWECTRCSRNTELVLPPGPGEKVSQSINQSSLTLSKNAFFISVLFHCWPWQHWTYLGQSAGLGSTPEEWMRPLGFQSYLKVWIGHTSGDLFEQRLLDFNELRWFNDVQNLLNFPKKHHLNLYLKNLKREPV